MLTLDIIPEFHTAAWNGPIASGAEYISSVLLPQSDVLILSEFGHDNSQTIYADFFSEDKLNEYASQGVTDIYIEDLESLDHLVKDLVKDDIGREAFIEAVMADIPNPHVTKDEHLAQVGDIADAIINASKTNPPITFHFAQTVRTAEQNEEMGLFDQQLKSHGDEFKVVADEFLSSCAEQGLNTEGYRGALLEMEEGFGQNRITFLRGVLGGKDDWFEQDIREHLSSHLQGKVSDEKIEELGDKLIEIRDHQKETMSAAINRGREFQMDDTVLANKILETKDPEGTAIVMHGGSHGAKNNNDLDEHLQNEGLAVNRVNVYYDIKDITEGADGLSDMADMHYSPLENKMLFFDWNEDGKVNGTIHDVDASVAPENPVIDKPVISESLVITDTMSL